MNKKSKTCKGSVSGKPLTEYPSEWEAAQGAEYENAVNGRDFHHYKCQKCERWHLSLGDRQTPSRPCISCDGKQLYETEAAAKRRAEISRRERGVSLNVYKCDYNNGWHLTRNQSQY